MHSTPNLRVTTLNSIYDMETKVHEPAMASHSSTNFSETTSTFSDLHDANKNCQPSLLTLLLTLDNILGHSSIIN